MAAGSWRRRRLTTLTKDKDECASDRKASAEPPAQLMSVGRHTLTETMKKTWNAIRNPFRQRPCDETRLRDDYPSDSEFTDDEERRREWQRHLNRRATIATCTEAVTNFGIGSENVDNAVDDQWEYESEYNVSFRSDSSIIDAFQESRYNGNEFKPYNPAVIDKISPLDHPGYVVESERHIQFKEKRPSYFHSPTERKKDESFPRSRDRALRNDPKSVVRERITEFERGSNKRRDSVHPHLKAANRQTIRRESSERDLADQMTETTMKRKVRKQIKQRKRAKDISADESDVESVELKSSKYAVNLTMEDLHDIIKKNVSSAVKTIVSTNAKDKKIKRAISPVGSFSTESETIFSGSSSQSTDANLGGLLHKQIKAQLDRDKLKGLRKASLPVSNLQIKEHEPVIIPNSNPVRPSITPLLSMFSQQQPTQVVVQESQHFTDVQQQHVPQVTFKLADTQPAKQLIMTADYEPQSVTLQTNPRGSVVPAFHRPSFATSGDLGNIGVVNNFGQVSPPLHSPQLSPSQFNQFNKITDFCGQMEPPTSNPFNTVCTATMSQAALSRLRTRRHTLATIGSEYPFSFDPRLDHINNSSCLLDGSVKRDEHGTDDKTINNKNTDNEVKANLDSNDREKSETTADAATRPLTIAEQIEALTKKKKKPKKPLKPGQMGLTSCARALLILTNIMFLLVGAGSLGVGVWMLMDPKIETYFDILNVDRDNMDFKTICYILCGTGTFIMFIGFMGCCGTIRSSKSMLTVFIILTGVVTLSEVGFGTLLIVHKDSTTAIPVLSALLSEVGNTLKAQLTRSLVEKYDPETTIGAAWDLVQVQIECCGSNGPEDYKLSAWRNLTKDEDVEIPDTCCVLVSKNAPEPEPSNMLLCQAGTTGFFHDTGCFDALLEWFKKNSSFLIAALITVLCIEIFSLVCAIAICRKAHEDAKKYKDTPGLQ